jgi:hypothetical protein
MTAPIRRPDAAVVYTTPRPTPTPVRASVAFSAVLGTLGSGASMVVGTGASALGLRFGGGMGMPILGGGYAAPAMNLGASPEGPGGVSVGAGGPAGMGGMLADSYRQNMEMLQLQEAVNQQNRFFTTVSNIEKAEHDTLRNTIGNMK